MRMSAFVLTIALLSAVIARADDSAAINKLIAEIDAAAKINRARILSIIILNTDVAGQALEKEAARNHFTLGEVYVAHSIALASHKRFDQIAAMKASGKSWAQVAQTNRVSLHGTAAAMKDLMKEEGHK